MGKGGGQSARNGYGGFSLVRVAINKSLVRTFVRSFYRG